MPRKKTGPTKTVSCCADCKYSYLSGNNPHCSQCKWDGKKGICTLGEHKDSERHYVIHRPLCEWCNGEGKMAAFGGLYECTHCGGSGLASEDKYDDVSGAIDQLLVWLGDQKAMYYLKVQGLYYAIRYARDKKVWTLRRGVQDVCAVICESPDLQTIIDAVRDLDREGTK